MNNKKEYTIVPISEIKFLDKDIIFGQGLTYGAEFKALYKDYEGRCGTITIHILGKLNAEWKNKVETAYKLKQELQMPLILQDETTFIAAPSTM